MRLSKITLRILDLTPQTLVFLLYLHKIVHALGSTMLIHVAEGIRFAHLAVLPLHTLKSAPQRPNIRLGQVRQRQRKMRLFKLMHIRQNNVPFLRQICLACGPGRCIGGLAALFCF